MGPPHSLKDCIEEGRQWLARMAGVDYEYDLQKWHDHFKQSREGGYTWNRTIALPKIMQEALDSEEWREAVRSLRSRTLKRQGKKT